ncbi:hypothetical protein GO003_018585 [Methylicorpusculum oleiharenae]|uniref:hypothetical protein n=1 Tax=Methylicorpusculum oleiharenae TaxID=1338687 RepID=UPI00135CC56F|nr:hypothetical protein [Methylicorpusculum oleiharenae]MCD2452397.1 hypothetical protein [Methylicorpusculum oleiharenae]
MRSLIRIPQNRQIILYRLVAVLIGLLMIGLAYILYDDYRFNDDLNQLKNSSLIDCLRKTLPEQFIGDGVSNIVNKNEIKSQIHRFNQQNWFSSNSINSLGIVKIGEVNSDEITNESGYPFSIVISGEKSSVTIDLVVKRNTINTKSMLTISNATIVLLYAVLSLGLIWVLPIPASINTYLLARDMSLVFDRKVSAGQPWGIYCLSHLGGGGHLPGIPDNGFNACNNGQLLKKCFYNIESTYQKLRSHFAHSITDTRLQTLLVSTMDNGFLLGNQRIRDAAPIILDEGDVSEKFRPFIYQELFSFIVLNCKDHAAISSLLRIDPLYVTIEREPMWLIGGYEIYYPKPFFEELVEEIRSGLLSAYARSFNKVRIFANKDKPFISFDFQCTDLEITPDNVNRLQQYIDKPYQGGLHRIRNLMIGFGDVSIFDRKIEFSITQRKTCNLRSHDALVVRLDFRRVWPNELQNLRKYIST